MLYDDVYLGRVNQKIYNIPANYSLSFASLTSRPQPLSFLRSTFSLTFFCFFSYFLAFYLAFSLTFSPTLVFCFTLPPSYLCRCSRRGDSSHHLLHPRAQFYPCARLAGLLPHRSCAAAVRRHLLPHEVLLLRHLLDKGKAVGLIFKKKALYPKSVSFTTILLSR